MCYTLDCHTNGSGAFCFYKKRHCGQSEYSFWAKRPVLSDSRPAVCVTAMADSTGRFAMSKACSKCGGPGPFYREKRAKDGLRAECKRCSDARNRENYSKNKEAYKSRARRWGVANAAQVKKFKESWRHNNPGYWNEWRADNPELARMHSQRRRAHERAAVGSYTPAEWKALCAEYDYKCVKCGQQVPLTVDHVIPLSKGGSNSIDNIQPLCQPCNSGKKDRIADYRKGNGGIARWIQRKLFE